ncbi:hypothetical protein MC7420_4889 [Coleofasciculus chthonoplastes PCC 7420]|uniref:Uncharacterized protein n=1 Tax=Coleofasciculus chthonoplastes PCC 7420 TaxID=118168 RepID=B4VNA3_9CYAN|nr:hypothetical protein MC7420_4889 [Coleofasciculus chthonoplastes PCC 7420]
MLEQSEEQDKILGILDKVSAFSFIFAVLFTLIIGIDSATHSLNKPEITMNQDYSNRINNYPAYQRGNGSVNEASKLRPQPPQSRQSPNTPSATSAPKSSEGNQSGNSGENSGSS